MSFVHTAQFRAHRFNKDQGGLLAHDKSQQYAAMAAGRPGVLSSSPLLVSRCASGLEPNQGERAWQQIMS